MTYTKAMHTKQNVPHTKNTLLRRFAPFSLTIYGVEYAMAQLRSQLDACYYVSELLDACLAGLTYGCHGQALRACL
jgi:hypothetical protein